MMMNRKQLQDEITRADANARQARKDGRMDAESQWSKYALELTIQLANYEREQLRLRLAK
jgi:hypothetical protein